MGDALSDVVESRHLGQLTDVWLLWEKLCTNNSHPEAFPTGSSRCAKAAARYFYAAGLPNAAGVLLVLDALPTLEPFDATTTSQSLWKDLNEHVAVKLNRLINKSSALTD